MPDHFHLAGESSGVVGLFPLPNLVIFPHLTQRLHVFEPRYRQLIEDALSGNRLIALALLKPGWEPDYIDEPAIHDTVCTCSIVAEEKLEDGRYNLIVRGVNRARIIDECASDKLYRTANVQLLDDLPVKSQQLEQHLRHLLVEQVRSRLSADDDLEQLLECEVSLSLLCDALAFVLPLPLELRQSLLNHINVERRVTQLIEYFGNQQFRPYPPSFSAN